MAMFHRLKSSNGRWGRTLGGGSTNYATQWISEEMLDMLRTARASNPQTPAPQLDKALDLAGKMEFHSQTDKIMMPLTPEQIILVEQRLTEKKKGFFKGREGVNLDQLEQVWRDMHDRHKRVIEKEVATYREVRFLGMPLLKWEDTPGDATMFEQAVASKLITQAKLAIELRKVLPKARVQAVALGGVENSDMLPKMENIGTRTKDLAEAEVVKFSVAEEFEEKHAIAVYVNVSESKRGFLNKTGQIKNNLAEASLFPNKKAATSFARRFFSACHAVSVLASAVAYEPLLGIPTPAEDLAEAIAERERKTLMKALGDARIEQLEEELARRKEQEPEEPPKSHRPARSSRL